MTWKPVKGAKAFKVYKNGSLLTQTAESHLTVEAVKYASYTVSVIDNNGYEGFMSEPVVFAQNTQTIEVEQFAPRSKLPYTNYSGDGFVEISTTKNRVIEMEVAVEKAADYLIDVHYSNGSGRWNTNNKCAIRSLSVNGTYEGVLVFPQRGKDEWSEWGYSNSIEVSLPPGTHTLRIHFEDWNNNMDVEVNTAMLDYIRIIEK